MTRHPAPSLGWSRAGWLAALGLALLVGPTARAQETPRDESEPRASASEDTQARLDRLINARVDVDLLEWEVAAEKERVQELLKRVAEEESGRENDRTERLLQESKLRYREKSLDLAHARQRLADLAGEPGEPEAVASPTGQDQRFSEIIRGVNALLKTVEHAKDRPEDDD